MLETCEAPPKLPLAEMRVAMEIMIARIGRAGSEEQGG